MNSSSPEVEQVITTTGISYQWVDAPMTVALVFGLAGAVYLGIYCIRRIRASSPAAAS
jgi:hypothetical protein